MHGTTAARSNDTSSIIPGIQVIKVLLRKDFVIEYWRINKNTVKRYCNNRDLFKIQEIFEKFWKLVFMN